jgi:battenin
MINLALVYFLEYMCTTCFADRITLKIRAKYPERSSNYLYQNGFIIIAFCYQIGVFISRSSLALIKIKRVEIMTIF